MYSIFQMSQDTRMAVKTVDNKFLIFKMSPGVYNKFKFLVAKRYIIKGNFIRFGPPTSDDKALADVYTLPIDSIVELISVGVEEIPTFDITETEGHRIAKDNYITIIVRITKCRPNKSGTRFTVDTTSGQYHMPLWSSDFKDDLTYFTLNQSYLLFNVKVGEYNHDIQLQYSPFSCAVKL